MHTDLAPSRRNDGANMHPASMDFTKALTLVQRKEILNDQCNTLSTQ